MRSVLGTKKRRAHQPAATRHPMDLRAMTCAICSRGEKRAASAYGGIIAQPYAPVNAGRESFCHPARPSKKLAARSFPPKQGSPAPAARPVNPAREPCYARLPNPPHMSLDSDYSRRGRRNAQGQHGNGTLSCCSGQRPESRGPVGPWAKPKASRRSQPKQVMGTVD